MSVAQSADGPGAAFGVIGAASATARPESEPLRILVDGSPAAVVPIDDRALHYGDGLFETLAVREGCTCQWPRHLTRLETGCRRLGIEPPPADRLSAEVSALAAETVLGVLKLIVTRGSAGRGYAPPAQGVPRRILLLYGPVQYPADRHERGVAVRTCTTPASLNPALSGIKHLNRLDHVLARSEWTDPDIAEGLMLAPGGEIVGGTMTNLFLWDGRGLVTPALDRFGVAGTVRSLALELAGAMGIPCVERPLTRADLETGQGLFLTNAVAGVWPVRRIDGRALDPCRLPRDLIAAVHRAALRPDRDDRS